MLTDKALYPFGKIEKQYYQQQAQALHDRLVKAKKIEAPRSSLASQIAKNEASLAACSSFHPVSLQRVLEAHGKPTNIPVPKGYGPTVELPSVTAKLKELVKKPIYLQGEHMMGVTKKDIGTLSGADASLKKCKTWCNLRDKCAGFDITTEKGGNKKCYFTDEKTDWMKLKEDKDTNFYGKEAFGQGQRSTDLGPRKTPDLGPHKTKKDTSGSDQPSTWKCEGGDGQGNFKKCTRTPLYKWKCEGGDGQGNYKKCTRTPLGN